MYWEGVYGGGVYKQGTRSGVKEQRGEPLLAEEICAVALTVLGYLPRRMVFPGPR
jgi:hypothetical protein